MEGSHPKHLLKQVDIHGWNEARPPAFAAHDRPLQSIDQTDLDDEWSFKFQCCKNGTQTAAPAHDTAELPVRGAILASASSSLGTCCEP